MEFLGSLICKQESVQISTCSRANQTDNKITEKDIFNKFFGAVEKT